MAIEKRKERRIKVSLPIRIIYRKNTWIQGRIENISRLGAFVEADKEIPAGEDIDIVFEIPTYAKDPSLAGEVKCRGSIFRSHLVRELNSKKYYGMGVFFTGFSSQADRDKLSKYIDFLILKEEQEIKAGIKRWRGKRISEKKSKSLQKSDAQIKDYQAEVIILLKEILGRLDELFRLLKSQGKIS